MINFTKQSNSSTKMFLKLLLNLIVHALILFIYLVMLRY